MLASLSDDGRVVPLACSGRREEIKIPPAFRLTAHLRNYMPNLMAPFPHATKFLHKKTASIALTVI
jgi:hypothetical protein